MINMFKRKEKAQMMVLDIIIAIVLITLIFFLLNRFSEVRVYRDSSDYANKELNEVANLAFKNLTNNSKINCVVSNSDNSFVFRNCFYENSNLNKQTLGILDSYNAYVAISGFNLLNNSLSTNIPSGIDDYYEIKLNVITNDSKYVSKGDYLDCIEGRGTCVLNTNILTLKVWKDE